ncbi:hypothetical protein N7461_005557 [Penicillium sp. DV-2018c]|nr:hypothetical protein N7461_005557 [Penicillium sp. DV-2018c]
MPRCALPLSPHINKMHPNASFRVWEPLGLALDNAENMLDRTAVESFLRILYNPFIMEWLLSAEPSESCFRYESHVALFQTIIFNHLGHLPPRVLDAEPDRWELVYHLYYLLTYLRYTDAAWIVPQPVPLPELPPLLAPDVHFPALRVPIGFPGTGPPNHPKAGHPGWPLPPPPTAYNPLP